MEYRFGLDKNRRRLTRYQSPEFMKQIAVLPRRFKNRKGEGNGNNKLTESHVRQIRNSKESATMLANRYMISIRYVYILRAKKTWKHI